MRSIQIYLSLLNLQKVIKDTQIVFWFSMKFSLQHKNHKKRRDKSSYWLQTIKNPIKSYLIDLLSR